ncbi:TetR/AcrR family transcriptional regulator C-terminal domain-containing protein [Streptomyces sp.]|uniref:TetR/AcrR family transcriptional regulator C-terminal domain-containing protein n=1 Tax=Streptomyces sp. TaxID=1931 RepID=UPI002F94F204
MRLGLSAIDSYVYGFVLTELNLPFDADTGVEEFVGEIQEQISPDAYPHLVELITEQVMHGDYSYADEFEYGLDLILDSVESRLANQRASD